MMRLMLCSISINHNMGYIDMSNTLTGTLGYFAVCDGTPTQTFSCTDKCLDWLDANCAANTATVLELSQYSNQLPAVKRVTTWHHPTRYERF